MMENKIKIAMITSFVLILIFELFIYINPITSYNLSIYSQVNVILLILIIFALTGIIILSMLDLYSDNPSYWKFGLFSIILINSIIILLPSQLGYVFNISGDLFYHVGYGQTIIETASFQQDIYPAIHILIAFISLMSNVSIYKIVNVVGLIDYILFIMSTYLLANYLLKKKAVLLATICSTVPFFYFYYTVFPMGYALILIIMILFTYIKYRDEKLMGLGILTTIFLFLMTFIHPVVAIILAFALFLFEISDYSFSYFNKDLLNHKKDISLSFVLILIILINLWLWNNFRFWDQFVHGVLNLFTSELSSTPLTQQATEGFSILNFSIIDIISLFIKIYGHIFIFGVISLFMIILLYKRKNFVMEYLNNQRVFNVSIIFLVFSIIALFDFVHPLTELSSGRLIYFPVMFSPVFVGLFLASIKNKILLKKYLIIIPILVLLVPSLIGIFSLHQSPITYKTNPAITHANLDGCKWIVDNGDKKSRTIVLGVDSLHRYVELNYGFEKIVRYPYQILGFKIPDHFNYTNSSNFGQNFNDTYMITRKKFILDLYNVVFPEVDRYNESDFYRLSYDSSVDKIYENGEIENWLM